MTFAAQVPAVDTITPSTRPSVYLSSAFVTTNRLIVYSRVWTTYFDASQSRTGFIKRAGKTALPTANKIILAHISTKLKIW